MPAISQLISENIALLTPHYGPDEARAMVRSALMTIKNWTLTDLAYHSSDEAGEWLSAKMREITQRLLNDEPLQYILGVAHFHGITLRVSPATLIPRPETAQLVDLIVDEARERPDLDILDIGTGSGAIAIALARSLRFPRIDAIDVSAEALEIARENARHNKVNINFIHSDIADFSPSPSRYDIIVSNPPYITESERNNMQPNVFLYEPGIALFVEDSDPLYFYRIIARKALTGLKKGGRLYFEINQRFGVETQKLVQQLGFSSAEIVRDFRGNDRFVIACKNND